jgi:PAS domain S-box-containing protein
LVIPQIERLRQLARVFADAPDAVFLRDLEGRILSWNRGSGEVYGWTAEEAEGSVCFDLLGTVFPADREEIGRALQENGRWAGELVHTRKDGSRLITESRWWLLRDDRCQPVAVVEINRDVTERKRAEARLAAEHAVTRLLAGSRSLEEAAPGILEALREILEAEVGELWVLEKSTLVQHCSVVSATAPEHLQALEVASRVVRFALGEGIPGRVWEQCAPVWIDDLSLDEVFQRKERALQAGLRSGVGFPVMSGGELFGVLVFLGSRRTVPNAALQAMMSAVCSELGQFLLRRRAELELVQAKEAAEAANQAKDQFLATLSHELRTPLTPVLALVTSLAEDPRAEELRSEMVTIRRNVELEARLIDDLLDLTRISRGKLDLHREVVDARKVVEHTIEICCQAEVDAGRLVVEKELGAADHRVWADPSRLTQVLWNLLNNAVKFTPPGGQVSIRSYREDEVLVLEVEDTGVGIEPALLPQIFGAFEQGSFRSPRRIGGLGLGLAISKAIVEMHGGELAARSDGRNRGALFTLRLPVAPAAVVEAAAAGEETLERSPGTAGRPLRILLVEDHADTAEAMAELLRLLGHRVTTAGGIEEARVAVEAGTSNGGFDLVVSDLGLPDGSGLDLMRELSSRFGLRGIALSGYGMEEDLRQSREAGFERHLVKPVAMQALRKAIREVAGEAAGGG